MTITIRCDGREWREESPDAVDDRLNQLHDAAERPTSASLELSGGQVVDLAVGSDRSFVQFMPNAPDPPYLIPVGDRPDERAVFVFFADGHWTEVLQRNTLPIEAARKLVRELVGSHQAPDSVGWEEA